ncbi:MAG TPA: nucleoside-diphosphate kinase [Acidothermaceae bacterium]|nr:nucleoside-diphosphate kinase [Acidothermaceae bacterium]
MSDSERTLVLVKPDGVARGLVGEVLGRLERKGLTLLAVEMRTLDTATAERHYAEHAGKPFFGPLIEFITSGPLVAAVAEGPRAIETWRAMMGPTDPVKAPSGTVRGDFGLIVTENLVHGSDSAESAAREIALFFPGLA